MLYPDLEEFKSLSSKGNLVPVYKEILADMDTPVSAYLKLGGSPSFLLESVVGGEKWARYSFLGSRPSKVIRSWGQKVEIKDDKKRIRRFEVEDPLDLIKKEVTAYTPVDVKGLPRFYGGLVGYIGYDMVRFFERIPDQKRPGLDLPDMFFMVTDTMLIFDSLKQKIKIVSNVCLDGKDPEVAYLEAAKKIQGVIERLRRSGVRQGAKSKGQKVKSKEFKNPELIVESAPSGFSSSFITKNDFEQAVLKGKEYIMSGDVVQVVLSQSFERDSYTDPFNIYRALRVINPSPYMYYIDT
ncbi:MAG TPA: chorismate-binding protein, partial [Thermodesulfovibrionales bacterium]|nr:chorismate-binding protein [Thermodesulfovibrionales bacterium]